MRHKGAPQGAPVSAGDARDLGLTPGPGRPPGGGNGNPFLYCCLENPMDRVAWRAAVHGATKSRTCKYVSKYTHRPQCTPQSYSILEPFIMNCPVIDRLSYCLG